MTELNSNSASKVRTAPFFFSSLQKFPVLSGIALFVLGVFLTGCLSGLSSKKIESEVKEKNDYVTVKLGGDVRIEGQTKIKRDFSPQSVANAGGGLGRHSDFGISPKSFTLTRLVDGKTNSYRIFFKDMKSSKWKNFLFDNGDEIFVHAALF